MFPVHCQTGTFDAHVLCIIVCMSDIKYMLWSRRTWGILQWFSLLFLSFLFPQLELSIFLHRNRFNSTKQMKSFCKSNQYRSRFIHQFLCNLIWFLPWFSVTTCCMRRSLEKIRAFSMYSKIYQGYHIRFSVYLGSIKHIMIATMWYTKYISKLVWNVYINLRYRYIYECLRIN